MTPRHFLLLPMFLLIFGPKTSGWIDVVSITSAALVATHFLCLNTAHIPDGTKQRAAILSISFTLLFGFSVTHCLSQLDPNTYQVLRFGRIIVNFLGVAALVSIYYRWFGPAASQVIMRHLFHCLVIHALIMLGMFVSPLFRDLIVNQVVQADPSSRTYLAKATGYRIAGLTDSWDALSGLQSLGLLMLPILLTRQSGLTYRYAIVATPILLFSVAISGRTGFITLSLLLPLAMFYTNFRKVHRATVVCVTVGIAGAIVILGPLRNDCIQVLEDTSLGRTLAMFGLEYSATGEQREHIAETFRGILTQHYFLPETWRTLLIGTGGSGRESWDYVAADNGLVLNLHNLGIGSFAIIYGLIVWMLISGVRVGRTRPQVAGVCALAVAIVVLIDIKVMYVFSRNGFSVMLLPVLSAWWDLASDSSASSGERRIESYREGEAPAEPAQRELRPPQHVLGLGASGTRRSSCDRALA